MASDVEGPTRGLARCHEHMRWKRGEVLSITMDDRGLEEVPSLSNFDNVCSGISPSKRCSSDSSRTSFSTKISSSLDGPSKTSSVTEQLVRFPNHLEHSGQLGNLTKSTLSDIFRFCIISLQFFVACAAFPLYVWNRSMNCQKDKTQRQLCKRLAGPFIPFAWSCLV